MSFKALLKKAEDEMLEKDEQLLEAEYGAEEDELLEADEDQADEVLEAETEDEEQLGEQLDVTEARTKRAEDEAVDEVAEEVAEEVEDKLEEIIEEVVEAMASKKLSRGAQAYVMKALRQNGILVNSSVKVAAKLSAEEQSQAQVIVKAAVTAVEQVLANAHKSLVAKKATKKSARAFDKKMLNDGYLRCAVAGSQPKATRKAAVKAVTKARKSHFGR